MRNTLYLIRGMSGSGKTTLAKTILTSLYHDRITRAHCVGRRPGLLDTSFMIATDDYFVGDDGVYRFDHSKLKENHGKCQRKAVTLLSEGCNVIVHNTFSCRWEMEPYLKAAKECDAKVVVIDLFDGGCTNEELLARGGRSIPVFILERMRNRWEHNWRNPTERRPNLLTTLKGIRNYIEDGSVIEIRPCGFVQEIHEAIARANGGEG